MNGRLAQRLTNSAHAPVGSTVAANGVYRDVPPSAVREP